MVGKRLSVTRRLALFAVACGAIPAALGKHDPARCATRGGIFAGAFEKNHGQFPPEIAFLARHTAGDISLRSDLATASFVVDAGGNADGVPSRLRIDFVMEGWGGMGCSLDAGIEVPGVLHYLRGRDPTGWVRDVKRFDSVWLRNASAGLALRFHSRGEAPEFDVEVSPGASIAELVIRCEGAESLSVESDGRLRIDTAAGPIRQSAPRIIARSPGGMARPLRGAYRLLGPLGYGFTCDPANDGETLVIDPTLEFSTLLGSSGDEQSWGVALVSGGDPVIVGDTTSPAFPTTVGVIQPAFQGGTTDAFVARVSVGGNVLVFGTFLGGMDEDFGREVATDAAGNIYVVGATRSSDFPVTTGAHDTTLNTAGATSCVDQSGAPAICPDGFVAKLTMDGASLQYATYVGGDNLDVVWAIEVDPSGSAHLTGTTLSSDFPTTLSAYQSGIAGLGDSYYAKVDPLGASMQYSSYLGGSSFDGASALALDSSGCAYIASCVASTDMPMKHPYQATHGGRGEDVHLAKLDSSVSGSGGLVYATYLGGAFIDQPFGIEVAPSNDSAIIAGLTDSPSFPVTAGSFGTIPNGQKDAFVSRLHFDASTSTLSLVYSGRLGGAGDDWANDLALDLSERPMLVGTTSSIGFPVTANAIDLSWNGMRDAFLARIDATGAAVLYATYLGAAGDDEAQDIEVQDAARLRVYLTGWSSSAAFPTTSGAYDGSANGGLDAFLTKVLFR